MYIRRVHFSLYYVLLVFSILSLSSYSVLNVFRRKYSLMIYFYSCYRGDFILFRIFFFFLLLKWWHCFLLESLHSDGNLKICLCLLRLWPNKPRLIMKNKLSERRKCMSRLLRKECKLVTKSIIQYVQKFWIKYLICPLKWQTIECWQISKY